MRTVFAIDPGPEKSAIVEWDGRSIGIAKEMPNHDLRLFLKPQMASIHEISIEMVACYGMAVGKEVFETCLWIGRFIEVTCLPVSLVYRKDVKMHLCQSMRAKDANIRAALIDKHGPVGTKKNPGALYGISGHLWAALAVADYTLTR